MAMACATPGILKVWLNVSAAAEPQNNSNNVTRDTTAQGHLPGFGIRRLHSGSGIILLGGLTCLSEGEEGVNDEIWPVSHSAMDHSTAGPRSALFRLRSG